MEYVLVTINHNLNTSSIEALAQDLSDRFAVTVLYGYSEDETIKKSMRKECQQMQLGIIYKPGAPIWQLNDNYYLYRINDPIYYGDKFDYILYDTSDKNSDNMRV